MGSSRSLQIQGASPNPARQQTFVSLFSETGGNAVIMISDAGGKKIKQIPVVLLKGENNLTIALDNLSAGAYHLRVLDGLSISETTTLMVE
jgi:hypothetical protein